MHREGRILLTKNPAQVGGYLRKHLARIPLCGQSPAHLQHHVLPFFFFPQCFGNATERLLESLLRCNLDRNHSDLLDLTGRVLDGNIVLNPVAGLGPCGQCGADLEVQDGLPGLQNALELRLDEFSKIPKHLTDALP